MSASIQNDIAVVFFSYNTCLQLELSLVSFYDQFRCEEDHPNNLQVFVIYKPRNRNERNHYFLLKQKFNEIEFLEHLDFMTDLRRILSQSESVCFVTDHSVFVGPVLWEKLICFVHSDLAHTCAGLSLNMDADDLGIDTDSRSEHDLRVRSFSSFNECKSEQLNEGFIRLYRNWWGILFESKIINGLLKDVSYVREFDEFESIFQKIINRLSVLKPDIAFFGARSHVDTYVDRFQMDGTSFFEMSIADIQKRFPVLFGKGFRIDCKSIKKQILDAEELCYQLVKIDESIVPSDRSPLLSVVIPCYNYGHYLRDAIESVERQSLRCVELIIVDGGSNDVHTLLELDKLEEEGYSVYRRSGRHMVGSNRNYGIEKSQSPYICCLDADDCLEASYLEKALYRILEGGFDVVGSGALSFGNEEQYLGVPKSVTLETQLAKNQMMSASVFSKRLWQVVGGYEDFGLGENYIYEDWHFWNKAALANAKIFNISDEFLIKYRKHDSTSLSVQGGSVLDVAEHELKIRDSIKNCVFESSEISADEQIGIKHLVESMKFEFELDYPDAGVRPVLILVDCLSEERRSAISSVSELYLGTGVPVFLLATDAIDRELGWSDSSGRSIATQIFRLSYFLEGDADKLEFLKYFIETRLITCVHCIGSRLFNENNFLIRKNSASISFLNHQKLLDLGVDLTRGREYLFDENSVSGFSSTMERIRISGAGVKHSLSKGYEVWLLNIEDSNLQTLLVPELKTTIPVGWELKKSEGSPRGFALLSQSESPLDLLLPKGTQLSFLMHPYSGILRIENLTTHESATRSLYHSTGSVLHIGMGDWGENLSNCEEDVRSSATLKTETEEWVDFSISVLPNTHSNEEVSEVLLLGITDHNNNPVCSDLVEFRIANGWVGTQLSDRLGFAMKGVTGDLVYLRIPRGSLLHFERNPKAGSILIERMEGSKRIDLFHSEFSKCRVDIEE